MSAPFAGFLEQLRRDLASPLPGPQAQYAMAPAPRTGAEMDNQPLPDARMGGVLLLLFPRDNALTVPLILRPTYRGVHSGQVAFPGGGREDGDPDIIATALREAHEEIGIDPQTVEVLGQLSPLYVYPSNYLVHPVVGWTDREPELVIDEHEVAQLILAPLTELLDPASRQSDIWQLRGRTATVPFFRIQEQIIWGATAMMLSEFLSLNAMQHYEETRA
jgi:8-oxo-dGTP pyrophosphatase MutT (NUDIX family)